MKKLVSVVLIAIIALGVAALVVPTDAWAKRPPAPCTTCAPTITLGDGRVCTLVACGSDCVYQCPF